MISIFGACRFFRYANLVGRNIPKEQLSEEAKEIERLSSIIDAMLSKTAAGSVNFLTAFNPIPLVQAGATFGELINFTEQVKVHGSIESFLF